MITNYNKYCESIVIKTAKFKDTVSLEEISERSGIELSELKKYLSIGMDIEHEHSDDIEIAHIIAMHHLAEHPLYYHDKLGLPEMERRLSDIK